MVYLAENLPELDHMENKESWSFVTLMNFSRMASTRHPKRVHLAAHFDSVLCVVLR